MYMCVYVYRVAKRLNKKRSGSYSNGVCLCESNKFSLALTLYVLDMGFRFLHNMSYYLTLWAPPMNG